MRPGGLVIRATHAASIAMAAIPLVVVGCSCAQMVSTADAGTMLDSPLPDVWTPPCEPATTGPVSLIGDRVPSLSTHPRPQVTVVRALGAADGSIVVLHSVFPVSTDEIDIGVQALTAITPTGDLLWTTQVARTAQGVVRADFGRTVDGWEVDGLDYDGHDASVWRVTVTADGSSASAMDRWHTLATDDVDALSSVTVVGDGITNDVYFVEQGHLMLHRAGVSNAVGIDFMPRARAFATRSTDGTTTCVVVREHDTGALVLVRLDGDNIAEQTPLLAAGATFNPVALAEPGACSLAYFAPDNSHPTRGGVRLWNGTADILGWRGTAPYGLRLFEGGRLAIAAGDPDWPDQVDFWWVAVGDTSCHVPTPALVLPGMDHGGIVGAFVGLDRASGPLFVLGGLTGLGEVAFATAPPN